MRPNTPDRTVRPKPPVGIVVLNWNGWADTFACLESLEKLDYPACKVVVVDNASTETPPRDPRERFPGVDFLFQTRNLGFVGGNNVGVQYLKEMGVSYVLLLNNDTEVAPDFLSYLVETAERDAPTGMVSPTIYYHAEPGVIWSAGGVVDRRRGDTVMLGIDEEERGQYGAEPRTVDWATGCALLIKMEAIDKIGLLDERFFAYYEEAEWCARARRAGFAVMHDPRAKVWHKISRQARETSPAVNYYMARNRLLYLKLTRRGSLPWINALVFDYARTLASWTVKPRWKHKAEQRRALAWAIRDFLRNRFGEAAYWTDTRKRS